MLAQEPNRVIERIIMKKTDTNTVSWDIEQPKRTKIVISEPEPTCQNPYSEEHEIVCKDTGEVCTGKEYLKTKHWKQLRKDIYCLRNGNCQNCHEHLMFMTSRLHHLTYETMGHETKNDLMLLCDDCHTQIHGRKTKRYWRSIVAKRNLLIKNGKEIPSEIAEAFDDLELRDTSDKYYVKESVKMDATEKQIDFATSIAEMLGIDLPEEKTKEAYHDFISEYSDEFYKMQNEIRYKDRSKIRFEHSYTLADGYNGDTKLNINPENL